MHCWHLWLMQTGLQTRALFLSPFAVFGRSDPSSIACWRVLCRCNTSKLHLQCERLATKRSPSRRLAELAARRSTRPKECRWRNSLKRCRDTGDQCGWQPDSNGSLHGDMCKSEPQRVIDENPDWVTAVLGEVPLRLSKCEPYRIVLTVRK